MQAWTFDMYFVQGLWRNQGHDSWYIDEAASITDPQLTLIIDANPTATGVCVGSSGNLTWSVCLTGSTTGLTEYDLDGQYHVAVGVPVAHLDVGQIFGRVDLSANQKENLTRQGTWAIAALFSGHGLTGATFPYCTTETEVVTQPCANSPALACLMNNFGDLGNQDDVWELAPDCGF
jgi:hypothetical protein